MKTITSAVLSFPGLIPSDVSRPLSTYSTPFQANALWVKVLKKIFLPSIFLHTPFPRSSVRLIFLLAPVLPWPTMAPIKLRSTIIVVALLITSVAAGILFSPKPQSARLSSGHRLTLEKVTYGTNHLFSDYPHILDQLYSTVPSLRWLIPLPSRIQLNSSEPAVCLWLSEYDFQTNQHVSGRWQVIQVVDEHGCILHTCNRGYGLGEGPKKIRFAVLTAWPRHQEQFTANVFDQFYEGERPIATFSVRDPQRVTPTAMPEPNALPLETVAGPITVRLKKISTYSRAPYPPYFVPELEFSEQGKKSGDWDVDDLAWSDFVGIHTGRSGHAALCPFEPAWKLNALLLRSSGAPFPPENVWSLPPVKLPGPGEFTPLSWTTNIQGVPLSIRGIAGPGKTFYSNGVPVEAVTLPRASSGGLSVRANRMELECDRHHLALDCPALGPDQRLRLRYRQWPSGKPGPELRMTMASGPHEFYPIKVAPDTQAIQVEAIVQTGYRIEFIVPPPRK